MKKEVAEIAIQFLLRCPLRGGEVEAFNAVHESLLNIIEGKSHPVGNVGFNKDKNQLT